MDSSLQHTINILKPCVWVVASCMGEKNFEPFADAVACIIVIIDAFVQTVGLGLISMMDVVNAEYGESIYKTILCQLIQERAVEFYVC